MFQYFVPGLGGLLPGGFAPGQLLPPAVSVASSPLLLPPPPLMAPPPTLPVSAAAADPVSQMSDELQNTISSLMSKAQGLNQLLALMNGQKAAAAAAAAAAVGSAPSLALPPTPPAEDSSQYVGSLLQALQAKAAVSAAAGPPSSPVFSMSGTLGGSPVTPQGQKRKYHHLLPSPEPSPETDFIGQHSQGLGGHYAETYLKRKRY